MKLESSVELINPDSFEGDRHYYPRVLNAQIHPVVSFFLNLSKERLINRYCHLNPIVNPEKLDEVIGYVPKYLKWSGVDLFHVTTTQGVRQMVLIETNSCPSGQKSMPLYREHEDQGGYEYLVNKTFLSSLKGKKKLPEGQFAVIYDKNYMEASGYAASLATQLGKPVYLASFFNGINDHTVRFTDGLMEIFDLGHGWVPIRAALRYVTQKPWNRIPIHSKTLILNPILGCLAGGRNKIVADKAYDLFNAELEGTGLHIRTPETINDVNKEEIPLLIQKFGGHAVIKNPYSNAGQGVWTITSERELKAFMELEFDYDQFIVQSLIGNFNWSSQGQQGKYYHVGTVPNKQKKIYVADMRIMGCATDNGIRPIAIYGRRAKEPLFENLSEGSDSWAMLGTNLSIKTETGWDSDTNRLLLMDRKDFNTFGLALDDLIEGYIQLVLATISIDKMAKNLVNQKGKFRMKLFKSLNRDDVLLQEIKL